jgi:hypothetical protein
LDVAETKINKLVADYTTQFARKRGKYTSLQISTLQETIRSIITQTDKLMICFLDRLGKRSEYGFDANAGHEEAIVKTYKLTTRLETLFNRILTNYDNSTRNKVYKGKGPRVQPLVNVKPNTTLIANKDGQRMRLAFDLLHHLKNYTMVNVTPAIRKNVNGEKIQLKRAQAWRGAISRRQNVLGLGHFVRTKDIKNFN